MCFMLALLTGCTTVPPEAKGSDYYCVARNESNKCKEWVIDTSNYKWKQSVYK